MTGRTEAEKIAEEQARAQEKAEAKRLAAAQAESDAIAARQLLEGGRPDVASPTGFAYEERPWIPDARPPAAAAPSQFDSAQMGHAVVEGDWQADTRGTSAPEAEPVNASPEPAPPVSNEAWVLDTRDGFAS